MPPAVPHPRNGPPAQSRATGDGFRLSGVAHRLGGRTVLSGIDLAIEQPRVAIIGANGSGKTTLGRCLNGLVIPEQGSVAIDGLDTRTHARAICRTVGYVFQNPDHQLIFPTVAEDLAFGPRNLGWPKPRIERAVAEILGRFGAAGLAERPVAELSGGEKRLVTILSTLVMEPRHIVLDEPMTGLDSRQRRRLAELLAALPQNIVLITHDLDQLSGFDRAIALDGGRVVLDGEPQFVVRRWTELYG